MSKNQFTGTATQPQRNRNATANYVNLKRTSTVGIFQNLPFLYVYIYKYNKTRWAL